MIHGKTAQARRRRTRRTVALVAAVALALGIEALVVLRWMKKRRGPKEA